jgi:hypothetical protein
MKHTTLVTAVSFAGADVWKIIRLGAFKIDTSCCRQSATSAIFIDFLLGLKFILR